MSAALESMSICCLSFVGVDSKSVSLGVRLIRAVLDANLACSSAQTFGGEAVSSVYSGSSVGGAANGYAKSTPSVCDGGDVSKHDTKAWMVLKQGRFDVPFASSNSPSD